MKSKPTPAGLEDLQSMTKEELIDALVMAKITEARLKKRLSGGRSWCGKEVHSYRQEEYQIIVELSGEFPIRLLCEKIGIPRSSFYNWKKSVESPSEQKKRLAQSIELFQQYHSRFPSVCRMSSSSRSNIRIRSLSFIVTEALYTFPKATTNSCPCITSLDPVQSRHANGQCRHGSHQRMGKGGVVYRFAYHICRRCPRAGHRIYSILQRRASRIRPWIPCARAVSGTTTRSLVRHRMIWHGRTWIFRGMAQRRKS